MFTIRPNPPLVSVTLCLWEKDDIYHSTRSSDVEFIADCYHSASSSVDENPLVPSSSSSSSSCSLPDCSSPISAGLLSSLCTSNYQWRRINNTILTEPCENPYHPRLVLIEVNITVWPDPHRVFVFARIRGSTKLQLNLNRKLSDPTQW